ncbi:zinc finger, C2H2 type [Trichuris suis]|nr:zinc finger, C2H2 type [Trichuris suis]
MAEKMLLDLPAPMQRRECSPFEPPQLTYFGPARDLDKEDEDGDPPDCGYSQVAHFDYICNRCQVCCHTEEIYLEHVEEWHQNVIPKHTYMCNTCGHLSHNIIVHKRHKMVHRCDNVLMFMCKVEQSLTELKTGPVSIDERHEAILNRYYSLMQKPSIRRWLIRAAARRRRNKFSWKPKGKGPLFCSLSSVYREGRNIGKIGHSERGAPIRPLMKRSGEPAKQKAKTIRYDWAPWGTSSEAFPPPEDDADEGDDQLWLPPKGSEVHLKSTSSGGAQVIDAQVRRATQNVTVGKSSLKIKLPNLKSVRAVPAKHRRSMVGKNRSAMAISIQNSVIGRPPVRMAISGSEGIAPVTLGLSIEKAPVRTTVSNLNNLTERLPFAMGIPSPNVAPKGSSIKMAMSFPNLLAKKSPAKMPVPPDRMAFSCPSSITDEAPTGMGDSLTDKPPYKDSAPYASGRNRKSSMTMDFAYPHSKNKSKKGAIRIPVSDEVSKGEQAAFGTAVDAAIPYATNEHDIPTDGMSFACSNSKNEESAVLLAVPYSNSKKKKSSVVKSPVKSKNKICLKRIPGSNNYAVKKIEISKGNNNNNESEQAKSVRPPKQKSCDMTSTCPVCSVTFKKPWHAIAHLIDHHGGRILSLQRMSCQPGCSDTLVNFLGTRCSSCRSEFDSQASYLRHMFQRHTRKLFRRVPVIQSKVIFGISVLDNYGDEQWLRIEIRLLPKP